MKPRYAIPGLLILLLAVIWLAWLTASPSPKVTPPVIAAPRVVNPVSVPASQSAVLPATIAAPPIVPPNVPPAGSVTLGQIGIRDECILADAATRTYYMVGPSGRGVREYASKDLINWTGPTQIYTAANDVWGTARVNAIWAPEIHFYNGKYYLFLTFSTNTPQADQNPPTKPPASQRPLVIRGSTTLVCDVPTGPFKAMQNHSIPPPEMMTLDGTFWVEDKQPYMVFAHEWVQMTVGTIEAIKLKDDLSTAIDKPFLLFKASDAPWCKAGGEGGTVTDGPYLHMGKTGKLYMVWSSFDSQDRYNVGIAISASGKLTGPWTHQATALFTNNGGHPMLFNTFEGQLMMVFHQPNNSPQSRAHIYQMEDTGDTLVLGKEFSGAP